MMLLLMLCSTRTSAVVKRLTASRSAMSRRYASSSVEVLRASAAAPVFAAVWPVFAVMFDFILGIVQSAASLIDTVLGTDMSGAVSNFRGTVATKVEEIVGDQVEVMQKLSASDYQIQRIEYGDAWAAGNDFGAGLEDKISGAFNLGGGVDYGLEGINTGFNLDDITANRLMMAPTGSLNTFAKKFAKVAIRL